MCEALIRLNGAFVENKARISREAARRRLKGRVREIDMPQIGGPGRVGRLTSGDPTLARLPALPRAGREAEDLDP
jgi:hypothetical protein